MRKFAGLVAAAGMSSRMGEFKPLLEINGFPMIGLTVQSLKNAGVDRIVVVVGRHGEQMKEALKPLGVETVENPDYAGTDMLHSVKLGLSRLEPGAEVFFLPGDVPLVSPAAMAKLKGCRESLKEGTQALIPRIEGRDAHPPLLLPEACRRILSWRGEGGLHGALEGLPREYEELTDPGMALDADRKKDLEALRARARECRGISRRICESFYEELSLPQSLRKHCLAVGELAARMAEKLIRAGACLDVELCRSGGMVHDLCKGQPGHESRVREFLESRGYLALGRIAGAHGKFSTRPESLCREEVLVCLADKLIKEDRQVTLEERYQKAFCHEVVRPELERSYRICRELLMEYEERTGERLYGEDVLLYQSEY